MHPAIGVDQSEVAAIGREAGMANLRRAFVSPDLRAIGCVQGEGVVARPEECAISVQAEGEAGWRFVEGEAERGALRTVDFEEGIA
jgi:hypothetical protein